MRVGVENVLEGIDDVDVLDRVAEELAQRGEWARAARVNQHRLRIAEHPQAWMRLGRAFLGLGRADRAAEAYQRAAALGATDYAAVRLLDRCFASAAAADGGFFVLDPGRSVIVSVPIEHLGGVLPLAGTRLDIEITDRSTVVLRAGAAVIDLDAVDSALSRRIAWLHSIGHCCAAAIARYIGDRVEIIISEIEQRAETMDVTAFPGAGVGIDRGQMDWESALEGDGDDVDVEADLTDEEEDLFSEADADETGDDDVETIEDDDEDALGDDDAIAADDIDPEEIGDEGAEDDGDDDILLEDAEDLFDLP
jgi:tetratricopeptide (TPR) repeat protein